MYSKSRWMHLRVILFHVYKARIMHNNTSTWYRLVKLGYKIHSMNDVKSFNKYNFNWLRRVEIWFLSPDRSLQIWELSIRIDSKDDPHAPSPLNVNITEYYLYSTSLINNKTSSSMLETKTDKCFYGAPTMWVWRVHICVSICVFVLNICTVADYVKYLLWWLC